MAGLDAGADDYLRQAVRARRAAGAAAGAAAPHRAMTGDRRSCASPTSRIDPRGAASWRGERELELTKTEFDLLELLVRNAGIVLDHATIYERIWGFDFGTDSRLARRLHRLPAPQDRGAGEPRLIHTVRGVGYVVRES